MPRSRRVALALAPVLVAALAACQPSPLLPPPPVPPVDLTGEAAASGATAFYVDCVAGDDAAGGHTPASAWKTVTKAAKAAMAPGDVLMFKRGCTWQGQRLEASWNGTAAKPIKIGAYGTGVLPRLRNANAINVRISGSYLIVQDLDLSFDVTARAACGQPVADTYDVSFSAAAHHNTLQRSTITGAMTGVLITPGATFNKVLDNSITDNIVMKTWGGDPDLVLGAWGVLINGDDNEIARNVLRNNNAICPSVGQRYPGNSVEIYAGSRNNIHHNRAYGDRVFSELGSSRTRQASDNVFAYNLYTSSRPETAFVITRGALDTTFGPVNRTKVLHNTVYLTGVNSLGVVCGSGCNANVLTLAGNVVWAEGKALYGDDVFVEHHNVFWSTNAKPFIQLEKTVTTNAIASVTKLALATTSKLADPLFAGAASANFRLKAASPAIDAGGVLGTFSTCLGGVALPQGPATDAGAYEYRP